MESRRTSLWSLALALVFLSACGPTEKESGQAIVLVAPFITLIGLGVTSLFRWLWSPLVTGESLPRDRPFLVIGALSVMCLPLVFESHLADEWILMALHVLGTSYLALLLLCLRIGVFLRCRVLYRHVTYLPWLLLYPSAIFLAYFGSATSETGDFHLQLWLYPGSAGLVSGPLLGLLVVEVLVRRYLLHKREAALALPRPLPVAKIL
jgi:hypothetical protein